MKHYNENVKSRVQPRRPYKECLTLKNIFNTQGADGTVNSK